MNNTTFLFLSAICGLIVSIVIIMQHRRARAVQKHWATLIQQQPRLVRVERITPAQPQERGFNIVADPEIREAANDDKGA